MTYNTPLPPFKWFIIENFPYIEEDFDALTNWQLFCKLGKEMNKIIEKTNLTGEQVEQLTNAFNSLKAYIDNYFENLDVQDEIDNKLDEMAESGELTDIIAQYLQLAGVLAYDNKQAMKDAENLTNGSICKTLGDETYQDGLGFFYKVRQVRNTDIIDDELIIQLHDVNLVAERIPEPQLGHLENLTTNDKSTLVNAINNVPNSQVLHLGKSITYDVPSTDDIGHVQGACSYGNYLYVGAQGGSISPDGFIYVFNIANNTFVEKYNIDDGYHFNDLTYLDGDLYIACVDNAKIVKYDITNSESTTLDIFDDYGDAFSTAGISTLNGKLVGWLAPNSNVGNLSYDRFYIVNDDNTLTQMTLEDPYNIASYINGDLVRQQFDIDEENNLVYILLQQPNILIEATLIGNTIRLQKCYNMPFDDLACNLLGETEAVSIVRNDSYPKGSLFITAREFRTMQNTTIEYGTDTIQNYVCNPKFSATNFASSVQGYHNGQQNHYNQLTVKKTDVTNLIEQGSSAYPIKELIRGMNQVKQLNNGTEIWIRDSATYYLPFLYGYNVRIVAANGCTPTIYIEDITNCILNFETNGTAKITIKPINTNKRITIKQSTVNLNATSSDAIEIQDCQVLLSQSKLTSRRCKFTNTATVSSGYCFQVFDCSFFQDQFAYSTTGDKYINYGNGSIVATGVTGSNIVKSGTGVLLTIS